MSRLREWYEFLRDQEGKTMTKAEKKQAFKKHWKTGASSTPRATVVEGISFENTSARGERKKNE